MRNPGDTSCKCAGRTLWLWAVGCGVVLLLSATAASAKTTICHHADNNTQVTITVADSALPAHMAHGDTGGACVCSGCQCNDFLDPVACADGKTYDNVCLAECAGQTVCRSACACDKEFEPVTCADGHVYNNACLAQCAGQVVCRDTCSCPKIYKPVSCANGETYDNLCLAQCATGNNPVCSEIDAPC